MSKRTKELLRENNAWEKKMLSKENQDVMTDIVVYLRSAPISEYEQELVRRDIAMMLAEGQVDGRSAEAAGNSGRGAPDRARGLVVRDLRRQFLPQAAWR